MIIVGMVVAMSISTNAETVKVMDGASTDGSFTLAQTNGQDRRGTRQDCRQENGAARRRQARLQTAGAPELVTALPRVANQRRQGVALCHPLGAALLHGSGVWAGFTHEVTLVAEPVPQ